MDRYISQMNWMILILMSTLAVYMLVNNITFNTYILTDCSGYMQTLSQCRTLFYSESRSNDRRGQTNILFFGSSFSRVWPSRLRTNKLNNNDNYYHNNNYSVKRKKSLTKIIILKWNSGHMIRDKEKFMWNFLVENLIFYKKDFT